MLPWSLLILIFVGTLLLFFSIHLVANYFFESLFPIKYQALQSAEKRSCQHEFTSTVAVIWIFISFTIGAFRLHSSVERRWTDYDYSSYVGILLTLGYTTYEEILYLKYGKEFIYHLHHFLAALITIYACLYPKLHFFICWGGTIEITGIFVNLFLISKRFNASTTITNTLGGLMWLSFVIFRFISLVLMFIVLISDGSSHPQVSISLISFPYLLISGLSAAILFFLSLFWLGKMTSRLIQILHSSYQSSRLVHPAEGPHSAPLSIQVTQSHSQTLFQTTSEHQPIQSFNLSTMTISPSQRPSFSSPVSPIPEENQEDNHNLMVNV